MRLTKDSRFELRLTKAERELLAAKAKKAGISSGEFVRKMIRDTEIREAPSADVKELLRLMRHIGGNINQLLHRANTVGFIDTVQLRKDLIEAAGSTSAHCGCLRRKAMMVSGLSQLTKENNSGIIGITYRWRCNYGSG